jgi:hypothetical protein
LAQLRSELKDVPKSIEPIDWSHWERSISDKALVAEIRRSYESASFPLPKGLDLKEFNQTADHAIKRTSENAELSKAEIQRHEAELKKLNHQKGEIFAWSAWDYNDNLPGIFEQIDAEFDEGYWITTEAEEKVTSSDINDYRKKLRSPSAENEEFDPSLVKKIGDFDLDAEVKRVDQFLDKSFGDNEIYQKMKAAQEAKARASKHADAHHH